MTKRPRGRPREFDEALVLDKALDAFWDRGYEATSLDDLAAATGLARASIYAAFHDKETLYVRTLDRFADRIRALFEESSVGATQPLDALARFFLGAIAVYFSEGRPRGCLVMCTSVSPAASRPDIRAVLFATLQATERSFASAFSDAKKKGLLSSSVDPQLRAELAAATLHSIALRARAGDSRSRLERFARKAAAFLCERDPRKLGKRSVANL